MLSYIAVDVVTGTPLADLNSISFSGTHKSVMGTYSSSQATLPLSDAPSNWRAATRPYTSAIVCLADDGATPLWGAYIDDRETNESASIMLSLVSVEGYMDRRYVGDQTYTNWDQCLVVQDLVARYVTAGVGILPGIPIRVQLENDSGTQLITRTYTDSSDKTVLSELQALSGIINGPEWTVDWEVVNNKYTPVLRVGDTIGSTVPTGLAPAQWFTMPGCIQKYTLLESYKNGDGANTVMATSSGTGNARPQSSKWTYLAGNRPMVEHRWSPSSSITIVSTLDAHARRALAAMQEGATTINLTADRYSAPSLALDWKMGDTIGLEIVSDAAPYGLSATARVIGYEFSERTMVPIVILNAATLNWPITISTTQGVPLVIPPVYYETALGRSPAKRFHPGRGPGKFFSPRKGK